MELNPSLAYLAFEAIGREAAVQVGRGGELGYKPNPEDDDPWPPLPFAVDGAVLQASRGAGALGTMPNPEDDDPWPPLPFEVAKFVDPGSLVGFNPQPEPPEPKGLLGQLFGALRSVLG